MFKCLDVKLPCLVLFLINTPGHISLRSVLCDVSADLMCFFLETFYNEFPQIDYQAAFPSLQALKYEAYWSLVKLCDQTLLGVKASWGPLLAAEKSSFHFSPLFLLRRENTDVYSWLIRKEENLIWIKSMSLWVVSICFWHCCLNKREHADSSALLSSNNILSFIWSNINTSWVILYHWKCTWLLLWYVQYRI